MIIKKLFALTRTNGVSCKFGRDIVGGITSIGTECAIAGICSRGRGGVAKGEVSLALHRRANGPPAGWFQMGWLALQSIHTNQLVIIAKN